MPRVPDDLKERLKREISVQRLAEARGVKLKRSGKELIGLCPFHKDSNPSLRINPAENRWHCFGCDRKGDVIEWVRHAEGVSFHHAVELLKRDYLPSARSSTEPPPKHSTTVKLPPLLAPDTDDQEALKTVVNYYQETLKQSPAAQQYLVKRGLKSAEMVERFRLGFANRTLNYRLPDKNRAAGAEIRGRLSKLGVLREDTGHEHFNGSLVIPILDLEGRVVEMYGRKITRMSALRDGTPAHLYLPGPKRGVWNEEALIASKEIILCEALIDALTFWCAGYQHVTTSYGVNGFTEEIKAAFQKHGTKRIYIAYDRDDAGEKAAAKQAEELMAMGIECFRVQFPKTVKDANEYALKVQPAAKSLGLILNRAEWLGKGQRPTVAVIEAEREKDAAKEKNISPEPGPGLLAEIPIEPTTPARDKIGMPAWPEIQVEKISFDLEQEVFSLTAGSPTAEENNLAAKEKISAEEPLAASLPTASLPTGTAVSPRDARMEVEGETVYATMGERRYRILELKKNTAPGVLHVNLMVSSTNTRGETRLHVDKFDLYSAQRRTAFSKHAAKELGHKEENIERDLQSLILELEDLQHAWLKKTLAPKEEQPEMTAEEKAAAMELLGDPRLLDRVLSDFEKCGVVGEETNKTIGYLAAVSRLLEKPLAIMTQSSSSAGKSSLMDAVLDFMPDEQRKSYTAMTGQSLFYMSETNLQHKILAISEQQGAESAAYPLKLLQSEGKLKIASTGKDPVSGKHVSHDYEVEGPVMIFMTTTAHEIDEELLNRCLVLAVNEDREQTRAIHQKQREAQTIEGLWAQDERQEILKLHRNAQRLLRPLQVVNEHVKQHTFPDYVVRTRRDHMKFLTLVQAIALLYQHQREIKRDTRKGKTLEYIEATPQDVALAWKLVSEVLAPSLDELPPQTRRLLLEIDAMVNEACQQSGIERSEYRFSRATVRQYTRWSDSQLKRHLHRLEELEYLLVHRGTRGQSFLYELHFELDETGKPVLAGLGYAYDTKQVRGKTVEVWLQDEEVCPRCGPSPGVFGGGAGEQSPALTRAEAAFSRKNEKNASRAGSDAEEPENAVVGIAARNGKVK
jgi:DNA primase catalytic core